MSSKFILWTFSSPDQSNPYELILALIKTWPPYNPIVTWVNSWICSMKRTLIRDSSSAQHSVCSQKESDWLCLHSPAKFCCRIFIPRRGLFDPKLSSRFCPSWLTCTSICCGPVKSGKWIQSYGVRGKSERGFLINIETRNQIVSASFETQDFQEPRVNLLQVSRVWHNDADSPHTLVIPRKRIWLLSCDVCLWKRERKFVLSTPWGGEKIVRTVSQRVTRLMRMNAKNRMLHPLHQVLILCLSHRHVLYVEWWWRHEMIVSGRERRRGNDAWGKPECIRSSPFPDHRSVCVFVMSLKAWKIGKIHWWLLRSRRRAYSKTNHRSQWSTGMRRRE